VRSLPPEIRERLRPWQGRPVEILLEALGRHRAAVDLSDTGVGKTYVACAVAKLLCLPTLVVCPKISQTIWREVAAHFNDSVSVINYESIRTGNTPFGKWSRPAPAVPEERWVCQCCQLPVKLPTPSPCYCEPKNGIHCLVAKKTAWNYGDFRFADAVRMLIFDECHRCSGIDSLNADMLHAAKRQNKMVLGLSATAATGPLKMNALGYLLGLHGGSRSDFYNWCRRLGCRKPPGQPGFKWMVSEAKQQEIMRTIRTAIIPSRGVRVRTADIPNFPTRTISAELYDIENPSQIDALYAEMQAPLDELARRANADVAPDSGITKTLRAWQRIELLKIPLAVELTQDDLEKGYSVAIFCNFSATIDELARRLNTDCIIDGRPEHNRPGLRAARVARFQRNDARVILLNNQAGGVSIGLQDVLGDCPRIGNVFPCPSAEAMRQIFGRLPRDGGKSHSHYRVLFAANTGEKSMARALRAKSNNLDCLNDADCQPENFKLQKR